MRIKIKYLSDLIGDKISPPAYASEGAAGLDLSACIEGNIILLPRERAMVPTGVALEIPEGFAGFVYARSGLAARRGVTMANCVGVIDSDYRGEIICALINLGDLPHEICPGERIAQIVFAPVLRAEIVRADELDKTKRGGGGFGSTGR